MAAGEGYGPAISEVEKYTVGPIIPWPGSKRRLAPQLLKLFPNHTCYCEPFAGAAAMLFAKEPSKAEVINDINGDLVNLYRVVQHHLDELVRQFRWALTSRQMWDWIKSTPPATLTDVQRAARFYYLQRNAFGSKVAGQTFGYSATGAARLNLLRMEEELSEGHLRLSRVTIEHRPWQDVMARYDRPETFFFCDPPYWQTEGYGVDFGWDHYEALADRLGNLKGKAIMTINDHPDIRKLFSRFPRSTVMTSYSIGGGAKAKAAKELVIRTWD